MPYIYNLFTSISIIYVIYNKKKVTLLQDLQYQAQESLHSNINSKEYINKSRYQANACVLTNEISLLNKECNQLELKLSSLKDNYYTLTGICYFLFIS